MNQQREFLGHARPYYVNVWNILTYSNISNIIIIVFTKLYDDNFYRKERVQKEYCNIHINKQG